MVQIASSSHYQNNMDGYGGHSDVEFFPDQQHSRLQQQNGHGENYIEGFSCLRCGEGFTVDEQIVNSGGQVWHAECFV